METQKEALEKVLLDFSKRHMRAVSILKETFRPLAYLSVEIDFEKIKELIKKLDLDSDLLELPEDIKKDKLISITPLALDFSEEGKSKCLECLGRLASLADTPRVTIACVTNAHVEGRDIELLCLASIDLNDPDNMVLIPFTKEEDDDIKFEDETITNKVYADLRESFVEGFLTAEARKYLDKNPTGNVDAYVDSLPTMFSNIEGTLNCQ
jgi:hypothetical protein